MIIQVCDICKNEVNNLETIVLYKVPIDYCTKCTKKVHQAVFNFRHEIEYETKMMNDSLRKKEKEYLKSLQKPLDKKIHL